MEPLFQIILEEREQLKQREHQNLQAVYEEKISAIKADHQVAIQQRKQSTFATNPFLLHSLYRMHHKNLDRGSILVIHTHTHMPKSSTRYTVGGKKVRSKVRPTTGKLTTKPTE